VESPYGDDLKQDSGRRLFMHFLPPTFCLIFQNHPPQGGYRNSSLLTPNFLLPPSSLLLPPECRFKIIRRKADTATSHSSLLLPASSLRKKARGRCPQNARGAACRCLDKSVEIMVYYKEYLPYE
jgi:hypothetical protein